jgi:hypothetical protein
LIPPEYWGRALDCVYYGRTTVHLLEPRPSTSFLEFAAATKGIVHARVVGRKEGFFHDLAATLLRAQVIDVHGGDVGLTSGDTLLVPYPSARFTIGEFTFCRYDPTVGDVEAAEGAQILAFAFGELVPLSDGVWVIPEYLLAVGAGSGERKAFVSEALDTAPPGMMETSFEDLLKVLGRKLD